MTQRQIDFIARLATEKAMPEGDKRAFVERMVLAHESGVFPSAVSNAAASQCIDWLLSLPRRADAPTTQAPRTADPEVTAGRYALVAADGTVKFYAIDRPTEGRWAGYTFVNALGSDERYPIRQREERARVLSEIAADEATARVRYGLEIGRCGFCGRTLTDETSRAAGIGPDCAERHGVDRTAYTALAEALAAARERGDLREDGEDDGIRWRPEQAAARHTVYADGATDMEFDTAQAAVDYAREAFRENPMRRITVTDPDGELVVEYDL